jgi:hypothetical protein
MNGSRRVLIFGGVILAIFGMLYGFDYAVFIEHQTLDRMGGSLANAFVSAARGQMPAARGYIGAYALTKYNYVRQVDVHSHWIGLAMVMIVLGIAWDGVRFSERVRCWVATAMLTGSVIFPLGVILQTVRHGQVVGSGLAIAGSVLVTIALAATAWGFAQKTT